MALRASKITAIDFFDDLTSPYARKRFFWVFFAFGVLCCITLYLILSLLPHGGLRDVAKEVVVELLASVVIILAFYVLYTTFIGPNAGLTEVSVTRPKDIAERVQSLPIGARHYTFWGRAGSYFRARPLIELDEQSRKDKLTTDIEVVLPDPADLRLTASYQEILASLGENSLGNPLLANVLATSIACAIIDANNKYIRIRLFYSKFLPAFRVDISENGAILTQDDPAKSALFFESNSEFYEMFRTTVRNEMNVSREVKWDKTLFVGRQLNEKCCDPGTLAAFGLENCATEELQQEVAKLIKGRRHRYK